MHRASLHALTAALVIAGSATMAAALDVSVSLRQEVNSTVAPGRMTYSWKARGTRAAGRERLDILAGSGYLGDFGASLQLTASPSDGSRRPFFVGLWAPTGNGRTSNTTLRCRYDSRRDDGEERVYVLDDATYTVQTFDDSIAGKTGGGIIKRKRPAQAMDGDVVVERLKAKAKIRRRRDAYQGSLLMQATGVIASGDNADRAFKAKLKVKLYEAHESGGLIDVGDGLGDSLLRNGK